eukprot:CAMPEP_0202915672 /NCGR_PEP_ID=MMETSP1392-20130828/66314_1 /ASSEMBLY_ACC=CAM_ASM_000868 /TAXON_ID=225041 /ORGANISM="Chlamydomonas chlamydogama, Strain SAG 11-48b" /LENGTH=184 /DNA_ID=CAMNT_0049607791 /DNA_START=130 /DNA_END=681 /DNA_ORIENTATION=-
MPNASEVTSLTRALLEVVRLTFEEGVEVGSMATANISPSSSDPRDRNTPTSLTSARNPTSAVARRCQAARSDGRSDSASASGNVLSTSWHAGSRNIPGGPCHACQSTESPQWRRPEPLRLLLCNRCGVFFARHKRFPSDVSVQGLCPAAVTNVPALSSVPVLSKRKERDILDECAEPHTGTQLA